MTRVDHESMGHEPMADVTAPAPRRALPPLADADDDTAPRRPLADGQPADAADDDLTAIRSDLGVYDPTVPRSAVPADLTDDTIAATDLTLPAGPGADRGPGAPDQPARPQAAHAMAPLAVPSAPEETGEATWFVPDEDPLGTHAKARQVQPRTRRPVPAPEPGAQPGPAGEPAQPPNQPPNQPGTPDSSDGAPEKARTATTWMREIAIVVIIAMVCTSLVRGLLLQPFAVPSGSMENTLQISDKIVVSKAAGFTRGDVVVFRDDLGWLPPAPEEPKGPIRGALEFLGVLPNSSEGHLVKRVIGMPGDIVSCCDARGNLIVNGKSLDESAYLYPSSVPGERPEASSTTFRVTVPADRIFVLGDHRGDSADARCHLAPNPDEAFVSTDSVLGPVNLIVAPVSRWEYLRPPDTFDEVPDAPGPAPPHPLVTSEEGC